ncbi:hypothetical protein [Pseudomonas veronii]|uniref:Tail fiber protein n=1 Tax=Pseudomonas veronii TaxID=76761 RepID=A0A5M8FAJ3_PSEVE|nr:hypothetical protein [Pseudomonas veronii]KAA6176192.1 hypothetical protein F3K54_14055 [Pseudomonas veronii]KAA6180850.1 hypothetical protein F3K53_11645 [Pseudomonas veronii]
MFQIDNSTAVAAIPAPTPAGSAGYFTDGNPATGVSATILPAEFMNMLMMENMNVLSAAGITPAKGQYNQLALAIAKIVQSGAAGPAGEATAGILKLATSPQALAGTDDSTAITPLKLAQKLANFLGQATEAAFGWLKIATQALVNAGADDATAVTPKKLAAAIQNQALTAFTTGGSAGALTLAPVPAITTYAAPQRFRVKFGLASTGADTLNVSGIGAKSLKQYDYSGAKVAAVYAVGQLSDIEYDGVDFVLLDPLPANPFIDPWALQPIGTYIPVRDDLSASLIPSNSNPNYRYIKLTASDAYNTGALVSESTTGSAPLVVSTGVISYAGSSLNGKTINLINTEGRVLRGGNSGTVLQDAIQHHNQSENVGTSNTASNTTDTLSSYTSGLSAAGAYSQRLPTTTGVNNVAIGGPISSVAGGTVRTDTETRAKSIGVTYYMRIK